VATALGRSAGVALLLAAAGGVGGLTRWRARLDRTLERRRSRMRVELYTVNQMLAMNVRTGGGVVHAIQRVVERGRGEIVAELADALRAHASGLRAREALERIARTTPEPSAARTYRLLAASAELGTDLAEALRALSDDLRAERRDAIRREATRRRALMLVPIIGILAPTMLLFVAAPIPSLVFGLR
ncbi:MAG: type II secretion system F family protein, partial [Nitriliruptorales bacterium]